MHAPAIVGLADSQGSSIKEAGLSTHEDNPSRGEEVVCPAYVGSCVDCPRGDRSGWNDYVAGVDGNPLRSCVAGIELSHVDITALAALQHHPNRLGIALHLDGLEPSDGSRWSAIIGTLLFHGQHDDC